MKVRKGRMNKSKAAGGIRRMPIKGVVFCCAPAARGHAAVAPSPTTKSRRLVCWERSIMRGDGNRFTTATPSRLEARSRLGDKAANELGAPAVSSIPAQLPGPEPASARKGREDDRAVLRWNRRVAGSARRIAAAAGHRLLGRQRRGRLRHAHRAAARTAPHRHWARAERRLRARRPPRLLTAGLSVRRINPNRLRQFARARGALAKNDRLDARLIAEYVATMPTHVVRHDPAAARIAEIVTMRRQLCNEHAQSKTRPHSLRM